MGFVEISNIDQILISSTPAIVAFLLTTVSLPRLLDMIGRSGFTRKNYAGSPIPVGIGFVFTLAVLGAVAVNYFIWSDSLRFYGLGFVMAMAIMSLLGLIDDFWGTREVLGLKGHFRSLFRGKLTTGALKALGGFVLALLLSGIMANVHEIIINTLIIVLSINYINLLDLRPGRAAKGFFLTALLLAIGGWGRAELVFLAAVTGSLIAYAPYDLKAKSMMGDTGSNALGVALGICAVWLLNIQFKIGYLIILVALHLFAEKYSLTTVIAHNRFLNYLDRLWRK